MAKESSHITSERETAESSESTAPAFLAVVFKQLPPSEDFSCSEQIVLPGQHTESAAWAAVHAALRGDAGLIGGTVRLLEA